MKESGIYSNRMVHPLFPPLPFCIKRTIWRRWNKLSFYLCLCITFFSHYDMYLLCILWKPVDHDQPLFCLALSCFFPLTLIIRTLLNFLYSCYLRLESQKGYINIGPTHCIKTVPVAMTIDELSCVSLFKKQDNFRTFLYTKSMTLCVTHFFMKILKLAFIYKKHDILRHVTFLYTKIQIVRKKQDNLCYFFIYQNPDTLCYAIFYWIFEIVGGGGDFLYVKKIALCVKNLDIKM